MVKVKRGRGRPKGSKNKKTIMKQQLISGEIKTVDKYSRYSDAEVLATIKKRFALMVKMANGIVMGKHRTFIVSGGPGLGKTYTLEGILADAALKNQIKYLHLKGGSITGIELYMQLYRYRQLGNIILVDDCDSVFLDDASINLIKGATDTSQRRIISWYSGAAVLKENEIPLSFDFEGSLIFVTNIDFYSYIENENKSDGRIEQHIKAFLSRSHYLDLAIHHRRQKAIWVNHVIQTYKVLHDLTDRQVKDILDYINDRRDSLITVDIRTALKLADYIRCDPYEWREQADIMLCRPSTHNVEL